MRNIALAFAASLALVAGAHAQAKPDFSGTWRLDASRSDSATYPETAGPVSEIITQTDSEMRVIISTPQAATTIAYKFAAPEPVSPDNPIARWKGDTLVTEAIRDVRGQSVTVQQSRRLSADGKEMTVESIINVQHGYTLSGARVYNTSKDIFVKVPK